MLAFVSIGQMMHHSAKVRPGQCVLIRAEHAVDMETGTVVAVTLQEAHLGDTTTVKETLAQAGETVADLIEREAATAPQDEPQVNLGGVEELVADKGYHSGPRLEEIKAVGVRTYIPEKKQVGQRHWVGKEAQQQAVYANRQRLQRLKGKSLLRQRGEALLPSLEGIGATSSRRSCILRRRPHHGGSPRQQFKRSAR